MILYTFTTRNRDSCLVQQLTPSAAERRRNATEIPQQFRGAAALTAALQQRPPRNTQVNHIVMASSLSQQPKARPSCDNIVKHGTTPPPSHSPRHAVLRNHHRLARKTRRQQGLTKTAQHFCFDASSLMSLHPLMRNRRVGSKHGRSAGLC